MAEKTFNSRTIHKHDIEANWAKATFIPNQGEIIVYDIDASHEYERFKIGDGVRDINTLPFANGVSQTYVDTEISTLSDDINTVGSLVGDTAVSEQINEAIATKADTAAGLYAVTASSSDGVAYTATVPGITSLTAGAKLIIMPNRSSSTQIPTLNVNGLGAAYIVRRSEGFDPPYVFNQNPYWFQAGVPMLLVYSGTYWIVESLPSVGSDQHLTLVVSETQPTNPITGTVWFQI